jgi:hypothetical protein
MVNGPRTITLKDIPGVVTFLSWKGISFEFRKDSAGRVVAVVDATPEIYHLMGEFQSNPEVPLTDFLNVQRRIRGQMLDLRDNGNGMNGRRDNGNHHL